MRAVSINSIFEQVLTEQGLVRQFREEGRISIPTTSHNEGHKSIYSSPFMKELQGLPSFPPAARASAEITMHDKDAGRALPPTLIVHGLRDRTVPCKNSQTFLDGTAKNGKTRSMDAQARPVQSRRNQHPEIELFTVDDGHNLLVQTDVWIPKVMNFVFSRQTKI